VHVIAASDVVQAQPAPVTAPLRVSPAWSVSVTVTGPDVGPSPTLPTVIVRAGLPGRQRRRMRLADGQIGTSTRVVAGAVVTVLATPVVAARNASVRRVVDRRPQRQPGRGDGDLEAHRRARARCERSAYRRRRAGAEAHHHATSGELAEIVAARVAHRQAVQADAARDEGRPRRNRVAERRPGGGILAGVLHSHRVRQRVPEIRRGAVDGLRRGDLGCEQVGRDRHDTSAA
jgi:hypothetical protein